MSGIGGRISWSFLSGKHSPPVVKSPAKVLPPTSPPPPPPPPAPGLVSNPVISGTAQVSQTLTSTSGVWLNSPTVVSYQWFRGTTPIGTNAATYVLVLADLGALITCLVTVANGFGSANATSAAVGPVINLAPVNTVLPAITGTTTQGATLSVSNGTWTNTPLSFGYQWKRGGVAITSANSATYLLVLADVGATITCTVTATNTGGSTPATSASVGPIGAASGSLSILTAPSLAGDAVVGQKIFAINGTYSAAPDTITPSWYVGGVLQTDQTGTTFLVLDDYAGLAIGYIEVAHKSGYSDSASNAATSTGAVTTIDNGGTALSIPNAITSVTRTSASTIIPMTADLAFASNVYEGYFLRRDVYSDSGLTTSLGFATHLLTHADLQSGATIDWSADGGPTIAATNWITYTVFTTSPNGYMYYFTFPTQISPTDAVVAMTWSATDKSAGVTLSTDHLTMTNTTGSGSVRANRGIGAGKKVYWEYTGVTSASIGAADASATLTPFWGASDDGLTETNDAGSWVNIDGGILAFGTTASGHKVRVSTSSLWTNTDVLGLSLDTTGASPILAAYLNGTLKNSITMVGISLPIFPATQGSSGKTATLNPGITPGGTDGVAHPQAGFVNP